VSGAVLRFAHWPGGHPRVTHRSFRSRLRLHRCVRDYAQRHREDEKPKVAVWLFWCSAAPFIPAFIATRFVEAAHVGLLAPHAEVSSIRSCGPTVVDLDIMFGFRREPGEVFRFLFFFSVWKNGVARS